MTTLRRLLISLMLVPAALADAPARPGADGAAAKDTAVETKTLAAEFPPVLALAPDDALGVAFLKNPAELLAHPLWTYLEIERDPLAADLLKTAAAAFDGPAMLAVSGNPLNPLTLRVEFAIKPNKGAEAFFTELKVWMALAGRAAMDPAASVGEAGEFRTIRLPAPLPLVLFAAEKDGIVYASTRQPDVAAWRSGGEISKRLVAGDDLARVAPEGLPRTEAFAYLNTRGLMNLAAVEMERAVPGLFVALGLDRLEFAALHAEWSERLNAALTVGLAEGDGGVWDLLAAQNAPMAIPATVPADYTVLIRGAWSNAAAAVDRVNAIVRVIDSDIVDEFRTECAEFRAEYGFDPLTEFAGNFVDEWMLAIQPDPEGASRAVAVFRLADAAVFQSHVDALVSRFGLETTVTPVGGTFVYATPPAVSTRVAWAVVNNHLLVSDRPEPLVEIAQGAVEGGGAFETPALRNIRRILPADNAQMVFVNLGRLFRLALDGEHDDPELEAVRPLLERIAGADAGLGMTLVRGDGALTLQFAASPELTADVREVAWRSLTASLSRSRELSMRVVSASNMRAIVQACIMHANQHKQQWPASLGELVASNLVAVEMLTSPNDPPREAITAENADRTASYLYRDGTGLPADAVVLCERELREGGANFAFVDGHAAWLDGEQASRLLAEMRQAQR